MPFEIRADRPRLVFELRDGSEAVLSPLDPEDKPLLEDGLDHLSFESRYARFGQGRGPLTESELEYLANVDQHNHVAWGAIVGDEAAGVGRYIWLEEADCAEVAVTVIDEFQGVGLGTLLFQALTAIARADGVERFCFEVMPDNAAVLGMLQGVEVRLDESGSLLEGRFSLDDIPSSPHDARFVEVMILARAEGPPA